MCLPCILYVMDYWSYIHVGLDECNIDLDYLIEKLKPPEEGIPGLETSNFFHGSAFYLPGELRGPDV